MPRNGQPQFVLHMPVLHRGYIELFDRYPNVKQVWVIGSDFLTKLDYLRKDLRALSPEQMVEIITATGRFEKVALLTRAKLEELNSCGAELIMPNEDICQTIGQELDNARVKYEPVFLRWDRRNIDDINAASPNETVTAKQAARKFMLAAQNEAIKSSDIWRRVGAVLVNSHGHIIGQTFNHGEPSDYTPMAEGDPRNLYKRGVSIELSLFTHAEAKLIAEAAHKGQKLEGADLYVTTFPCPACAKLIAHSGIHSLYYLSGYAVLDGARILNDYKVKLIKVKARGKADKDDNSVWVPY